MRPEPESEERLREVLQTWQVSAPLPPRFQEQVWRRVAQGETQTGVSFWAGLVRKFSESFYRPKVACSYVAMLLAVGMAAGAWTAQVKSSRTERVLGERYVQSVTPFQFVASSP